MTKNRVNVAVLALLSILVQSRSLAISPLQEALLQKQADEAIARGEYSAAEAIISKLVAQNASPRIIQEIKAQLTKRGSTPISEEQKRLMTGSEEKKALVAWRNATEFKSVIDAAKKVVPSRGSFLSFGVGRAYYGTKETNELLKTILGTNFSKITQSPTTDEELKKQAQEIIKKTDISEVDKKSRLTRLLTWGHYEDPKSEDEKRKEREVKIKELEDFSFKAPSWTTYKEEWQELAKLAIATAKSSDRMIPFIAWKYYGVKETNALLEAILGEDFANASRKLEKELSEEELTQAAQEVEKELEKSEERKAGWLSWLW